MANQTMVRINDIDLRTLGLADSASFEVLGIDGRGLGPTRDRELTFPGDIGARDYGSKPAVRPITIRGILYADFIEHFQAGLDKLKEICRTRHAIDEMLFSEVEAQTLWFADESLVRRGTAQTGAASTITLDANASATDDEYNQMEVEIVYGTGAGEVKRITNYVGSTKVATVQGQWNTTPDSTSKFWIRDNRWHLVNYSGVMNEERMFNQWFEVGWSRITLPFKAVYPFSVGECR